MDEQPVQLVRETRVSISAEQSERYDYELSNGTAVCFLFTKSLAGWRKVSVRERKTSIDWAHEIEELLEMDYPKAETVTLVCTT